MSRNRLALAVGLLGFLIRLIHLHFLPHDEAALSVRLDQYAHIAQHVVSGDGFSISSSEDIADEAPSSPRLHPTAKRTPTYPLFLAALYAAGLEDKGLLWVQCLLDGLSCALLVWIAGAVGLPTRFAVLPGLAYAVYLPELQMVELLMTEPLFTALLLLSLWISCRPGTWTRGRAAGLGLLNGLAGLCRPTWLPYAAIQLALLLARRGSHRWRSVLLFSASFAAVVAPWLVRNAIVLGTLAPSTLSGFTLYVGNHPETDGLYRHYADLDPALQARLAGHDEVGKDRIFREAALERIRDNGWRVQAELLAVKAARFWVNVPEGSRRPTLKSLVNLPILLGVLLGAYFSLRGREGALSRDQLLRLLLPILFLWSVHTVFLSLTRMAFPVMPHAFLIATSALHVVWTRWSAPKRSKAPEASPR